MQIDFNQPEIAELRNRFQNIDIQHTGFITKTQFQNIINENKSINQYFINMAFNAQLQPTKMSEENFIFFMLGSRMGFEEAAVSKFNMEKQLAKHQSASPPCDIGKKKQSFAHIKINSDKQAHTNQTQHSIQFSIGINQQQQLQKNNHLSQLLGRKISDIYLLFKFKVKSQAEEIAGRLSQTLSMALDMALELGDDPKVGPLLQGLTLSAKHDKDQVYIIIQISHTFFSLLSQYVNEALFTISPQPHVMFNIKLNSNFSKLIQHSFDIFKQSAEIKATFDIDNSTFSKLKEMIGQGMQKNNLQAQGDMIFMFLFEQIRLTTSFSSVASCLESMGLSSEVVPKPSNFVGMVQQNSIKETVSQFIPDADVLIDMIRDNGYPSGQLSLNAGQIMAKINFDILVEGAFQML